MSELHINQELLHRTRRAGHLIGVRTLVRGGGVIARVQIGWGENGRPVYTDVYESDLRAQQK